VVVDEDILIIPAHRHTDRHRGRAQQVTQGNRVQTAPATGPCCQWLEKCSKTSAPPTPTPWHTPRFNTTHRISPVGVPAAPLLASDPCASLDCYSCIKTCSLHLQLPAIISTATSQQSHKQSSQTHPSQTHLLRLMVSLPRMSRPALSYSTYCSLWPSSSVGSGAGAAAGQAGRQAGRQAGVRAQTGLTQHQNPTAPAPSDRAVQASHWLC
jgi:hypothetical protein